MNHVSPEKAGISSKQVLKFVQSLENRNLSTHNVILARGEDVFFEHYWPPFDKSFGHRMYSVSKSIVSIAVGFCEQDGLLCLDDKISKYFPEEAKRATDENLKNQTIRHMLMMATAKPAQNWFAAAPDDRVRFYFENDGVQSRPSGTIYNYDSSGSFVLAALVERLTKLPFMEYLREKLFDKIGVSKEAFCLKCPGGHSWGDSGVICTPRDLLKIARFLLNGGTWNGEQILNERYVTEATAKQIDNNPWGLNDFDTQGYGFQFWRTWRNSFFFNGMGCQFAVCVPDLDLILVYNGDNQGKNLAKNVIFEAFFTHIADSMQGVPLAENAASQERLDAYCAGLTLAAAKGSKHSDFEREVNGVTFSVRDNTMGITKFKLEFDGNGGGQFGFTNAQGDKAIAFRMCENAFGAFPQEGYADEVGTVKTKGHFYRCAASAAWIEPKKLFLKVQIIDKYFGNLGITIGFDGSGKAGLYCAKSAEDFLNEYEGFAEAEKII